MGVSDDSVIKAFAGFLGGGMTAASSTLVFLPLKYGGAGFQSAGLRADAAWVASWEQVQAAVRADQNAASEVAAASATPMLTEALVAARARLTAIGAAAHAGKQKDIQQPAIRKIYHHLLGNLDSDGAALVRSQGAEGGAWLWAPSRKKHFMGDDDYIVCLRRRLLYSDPAGQGGRPCAHKTVGTGAICGVCTRQQYGIHPVCCNKGPGFVRRHNNDRDALAGWLCEHHGTEAVTTEQHIPQWDRVTSQGNEQAVLDVILSAPTGRVAVDVSIVEACCPDEATARARGRTDGSAARTRELEKHRRYPGPGLVAAVIEAGGRMGKEFRAFLRSCAPADEGRSAAMKDVKQRLAVALQRGVAAMLLGSAGSRQRPWTSACQSLGRGAAKRRRMAG